ncbi:MAG TPA: hypothetical protein VFE62_04790 [Gemmataceae bacterium]|nr:hypothetical protein [Gemmataceae bacterium]
MTLFASLVLERAPMTWQDLPDGLMDWLQNAGAVAAFGILLVLISRMLQRDAAERNAWNLPGGLQVVSSYLGYIFAIPAVLYLIVILGWIGNWMGIQGTWRVLPRPGPQFEHTIGDWMLMVGGSIALVIVALPIAIDLVSRVSWGRIWAIARLSWKEAIRGRVIWVFGAMALVFLFADWFVSAKAENLLRTYVRVVFWSMTPLFLLTAGILGSFSIPNDVKNNSIHTIVTKPVEKFEIVLGRFLGYGVLLTIGLFVVSSLSLIYVVRGVNEDAAKESYRARVPIYGRMHFYGTKDANKAESVGREWGYRSYISGPTKTRRDAQRQYAIWEIPAIPADLAERPDPLLFEYAFDIFRLSKGTEGEGVFCTFTFTDGAQDPQSLQAALTNLEEDRKRLGAEARTRRDRAAEGKSGSERAEVDKKYREELEAIEQNLLTTHHIYQATGEQVTDQHTQDFTIPSSFLKVLLDRHAQLQAAEPKATVPTMRVFMSVDMANEAQMVGVAHQDFYLLAYEMPFWQNFLKGVAGMWCTHMLVLGVALALSTYLSAVISFLGTMFLFLVGLFVDYLKEIAEHRVDGGGPAESLIRIGTHMPIAGQLEDSPTKTLVNVVDAAFSWWIGRIMNLIPNVGRHDLVQYVANGFDIGIVDVLLLDNILPLAAYLIPWFIVAYYLMKYREIANPS